jgi:hypothetical protein
LSRGTPLGRAEKFEGRRLRDKAKGSTARLDARSAPTLESIGVSYDQSSRWQALADIPKDEFERTIA